MQLLIRISIVLCFVFSYGLVAYPYLFPGPSLDSGLDQHINTQLNYNLYSDDELVGSALVNLSFIKAQYVLQQSMTITKGPVLMDKIPGAELALRLIQQKVPFDPTLETSFDMMTTLDDQKRLLAIEGHANNGTQLSAQFKGLVDHTGLHGTLFSHLLVDGSQEIHQPDVLPDLGLGMDMGSYMPPHLQAGDRFSSKGYTVQVIPSPGIKAVHMRFTVGEPEQRNIHGHHLTLWPVSQFKEEQLQQILYTDQSGIIYEMAAPNSGIRQVLREIIAEGIQEWPEQQDDPDASD